MEWIVLKRLRPMLLVQGLGWMIFTDDCHTGRKLGGNWECPTLTFGWISPTSGLATGRSRDLVYNRNDRTEAVCAAVSTDTSQREGPGFKTPWGQGVF